MVEDDEAQATAEEATRRGGRVRQLSFHIHCCILHDSAKEVESFISEED